MQNRSWKATVADTAVDRFATFSLSRSRCSTRESKSALCTHIHLFCGISLIITAVDVMRHTNAEPFLESDGGRYSSRSICHIQLIKESLQYPRIEVRPVHPHTPILRDQLNYHSCGRHASHQCRTVPGNRRWQIQQSIDLPHSAYQGVAAVPANRSPPCAPTYTYSAGPA